MQDGKTDAMKLMKHKSFCLLAALTLLVGCIEKDVPMKWVDLRYRVSQEAYLIDAGGIQTVSIVVKSTDPWEVFGSKRESWYSISPDKGGPDEKYTVTISCQPNEGLDDRSDTINVKSDYWIGKQFLLTQKGTAYMDYTAPGTIARTEGKISVNVFSNQKWSAVVTEGSDWLSIVKGVSGEFDGLVHLAAADNQGEQRTGILILYDRHGHVGLEVPVTQEGVILMPQLPENGLWFKLSEDAQVLEIPVTSNAAWKVSKGSGENGWYEVEEKSYEGDGVVKVNVSAHQGSSVRSAELVLMTISTEGGPPVVKSVHFRQANPPVVTVTEVNKTMTGGTWWGPEGLMPARYDFYLDSYSGDINFFWVWTGTPHTEIRYHIIGGLTTLSTTPWCSNVYPGVKACRFPVDGSRQNVLSLNIDRHTDDAGNEWIYCEWILNDEVIAHAISDGKNDVTGVEDTFKVPYANTAAGAKFRMTGNFTVSRWARVDHIVWE